METDIAWLAGIIDGEGSFELAKQTASAGYSATLVIYNTDVRMIENVERIVWALGATTARNIKPRDGLGLGKLLVRGIQICRDLPIVIEAVLPYLVTSKREFAADILALSVMHKKGMKWKEEELLFSISIRSRHMPLSGRSRRGTRGPSSSVLDGTT